VQLSESVLEKVAPFTYPVLRLFFIGMIFPCLFFPLLSYLKPLLVEGDLVLALYLAIATFFYS